jgi:hypothetical protein
LFKRVANGGPGGAPSSPAWLERLTAALGRFIRLNQLQLWVVSGSSSRALEGALFRIVLTFTRQASLGPQQPISFAVAGQLGGDIESETLALLIRNAQLC